jgi:hypothetical protein
LISGGLKSWRTIPFWAFYILGKGRSSQDSDIFLCTAVEKPRPGVRNAGLFSVVPPGPARERAFSNLHLQWYRGTLVRMTDDSKLLVERVQTGVRIEKRILKVLKAFAEYHDMTLGDVLEGIVLHAFDGKTPFSPASLERIRELKKFYDLDLDSSASHRLKEIKAESPRKHAGK